MKHYDRETNTWMTEDEYREHKRKRELCKGSKPHDFVLVLPSHARHSTSVLGIEVAEDYYRIMDDIVDYTRAQYSNLTSIGIHAKVYPPRYPVREYLCMECGKKDYQYKE